MKPKNLTQKEIDELNDSIEELVKKLGKNRDPKVMYV